MILSEKYFIEKANVVNKRVIVRVDYNVPTDENGNITDSTRIIKSLPTLKYLLENQAKIIIIAHKGRPKGKKDSKYSLRVVANKLEEILKESSIEYKKVIFIEDCIGEKVRDIVYNLKSGEIAVLENLRFYKEEKENDKEFAKKLAELGEIFVLDAFGVVHRAHASVVGIPLYLPYYYGYLIKTEVESLNFVLNKRQEPLVAIIGGSKISSKIDVLKSLLKKADYLLIGGAMAYTFNKAKGLEIGKSLYEPDRVQIAYEIINEAKNRGVELKLPGDHIAVKAVSESAKPIKVSTLDIPDNLIGVDIGPKTIKEYKKIIKQGKIIFWNGPMGIFEIEQFAKGTIEIAKAISKVKAFKVVGGGDSVAAVKKAKVEAGFSHISTGGGASLEYIEGKKLPGLAIFE